MQPPPSVRPRCIGAGRCDDGTHVDETCRWHLSRQEDLDLLKMKSFKMKSNIQELGTCLPSLTTPRPVRRNVFSSHLGSPIRSAKEPDSQHPGIRLIAISPRPVQSLCCAPPAEIGCHSTVSLERRTSSPAVSWGLRHGRVRRRHASSDTVHIASETNVAFSLADGRRSPLGMLPGNAAVPHRTQTPAESPVRDPTDVGRRSRHCNCPDTRGAFGGPFGGQRPRDRTDSAAFAL